MYVGIIQVELRLPHPITLKERRSIVSSLKERVRRRFKVSVSEVGVADDKESAVLGIALVSSDGRLARSRCQAIVGFLENNPHAEVVDSQVEVL